MTAAQLKSSQPTFTVGSKSVIRNRNYKKTDLFWQISQLSKFEKNDTLKTFRK